MNFTADVFVIWVKIRTALKISAPHRHRFCCFWLFLSRMPKMNLLRLLPVSDWDRDRRVFGKDERKASLGAEFSRVRSYLCFHLFHKGLLNISRGQSDFQGIHCPNVPWGGTQTGVLGLTQGQGPWSKVLLLLYQKRKKMIRTSWWEEGKCLMNTWRYDEHLFSCLGCEGGFVGRIPFKKTAILRELMRFISMLWPLKN